VDLAGSRFEANQQRAFETNQQRINAMNEVNFQAATSTAPFMAIFNGPDEDDLIGFVQEHDSGFKAFDTGRILLGAFASWPAAADAIWTDCRGVTPRTNGGASTVGKEPGIRPEPPPGVASDIDTGMVKVTFFSNKSAQSQRCIDLTLPQLAEQIRLKTAPSKLALPLLKLQRFGDKRTDKNCLRHNANVLEISGIEVEHDKGEIAFDTAVAVLRTARLRALLYTSPSYVPAAKEKWRILLPTSNNLPPDTRTPLVARVNGLFGGKLASESFVLSQAFYYGSANNNPAHRVEVIDGDFIDLRSDLDPGALGKDAKPVRGQVNQPDGQKIDVASALKHLIPQSLGEGVEVSSIEEIRSAALAIPPAVITDEPNWMNFARALAWEAKMRPERSEALWEILDTVSRQAPKYNKDNNRAKFDRYIDEAGTGEKTNTIATLFFLAREHGWRSPAELRRRDEQIRENIKIGEDVTESLLPQIMTLKEMHERLVFVGSKGIVADIATKRVRKKEHAADEYAASQHTYILKNGTPKNVPALKLWIASKDRITVEVLAWVPGAGVICQPPEGQGPAFNMWRGLSPIAFPEDWQERVKPFLEHVDFLVPNEGERERFLQWLAHIVQCPEVLPHTSYLMITPVTGIGRNLLASILVRALRGFVAAGVSLPELLDKGYTGRLSQKLLVIIDEAREGRGERRYERAERFKQLQTEEHRHVNHKYGFQIVEKNCGRWLGFSNHWDAIPFDNTDRRDIVVANPTVRKPDAYYERLYGLLNDNAFIGSVRHWLETKDITAFRPGEHAPMNPAKLRAIDEMMSETERVVAEFKEDCGTELTSRDAIKNHVSAAITGNGGAFANVNDTHLTHAIRRARMVNTGRRIMGYTKHTWSDTWEEKRFTVVIVRGEWTTEIVKKADANKLLAVMGLRDWSATKP
jgi:hypothetical protein